MVRQLYGRTEVFARATLGVCIAFAAAQPEHSHAAEALVWDRAPPSVAAVRILVADNGASLAPATLRAAQPAWQISQPGVLPATAIPVPLQKDEAARRQLEWDASTILVEGYRERDSVKRDLRTLEQRFADALNKGSPEMIAGHTYNGVYFDGTLLHGGDPLSFLYLNVKRLMR